MQTAPVRPRDPPTTTTSPESNLVEFAWRRGVAARTSSPITPPAGSAGASPGIPICGDPKLAGASLARRDPVAELGGVEADCDCGRGRDARNLPRRGVHPGGYVRRHDRRPAAVDRLDRSVGGGPRSARKAGAEDRIDDHARARQRAGRLAGAELPHQASEALQVHARVGGQLRRGPQEQRLDLVSRLREVARRDEPVSSVVPLAAHDTHHTGGRDVARRLRDRSPGSLHQIEGRNPLLLDRPGVRGAHPRGVEDRRQPVLHPGEGVRRVNPRARPARPQRPSPGSA